MRLKLEVVVNDGLDERVALVEIRNKLFMVGEYEDDEYMTTPEGETIYVSQVIFAR